MMMEKRRGQKKGPWSIKKDEVWINRRKDTTL
jgi:hypothetical protein